MRTLSDWDVDYNGDGSVTKRDFRRALIVVGLLPERYVADQLFDHLLAKGTAKDAAAAAAVGSKASSPLSTQDPSSHKMELWLLDRGLRFGSKVTKSRVLPGDLFQNGDRSVQEQLRDALVANSLRVIDLFREWDEDGNGVISRSEFRRALPILGLRAAPQAINALFDEFDADGSGEISFRELNRLVRRDVRSETTHKVCKVEEAVEIADVAVLRRAAKTSLLPYACVEVMIEDPATGKKTWWK
jgi:hypothetical protein